MSIGLRCKASNIAHWKHQAVELFLQNEHKNNQHEGTEHVRNIVQQKMWILGIRNALRSIMNKCVTCRKGRAQTIAPVMADLPEERLDASTAFTNVGVDYFGPFIVKIGRRNEKRWCCLFTCLTVRAVHIEVVPKIDTDSCLNAIMRFIARRGKPSTMISDNGTNFVGAEKEFAEYVASWNKERIEEHEMKISSCSFWSNSTTVLQWIHSSHRKQQVFVANRVAEILDTTDVSQWKHVSGINNPADIGTRAINIEELKGSEWLTGPAWLKRPESEWPEQVNLVFASDEENLPASVFATQTEEKKAVIQWELFSNFNRLVNAVAYVRRAISKHKPVTLIVSVEEREKAKATIFKLLQQEQFSEEMKSLMAEKEIPKSSKILQISPFLDEEGLIRAKGRIGKSQLDFDAKHPILLIGNIKQLNYSCKTRTRTISMKALSM